MKKLIVVVAFVVVGYMLFVSRQPPAASLAPQYPEPYIVVYGSKSDGNTLRLQTVLHDRSCRYHYVNMDAEGSFEALQLRMKQAGLDPTNYRLPVVEVNARMRANPDPEWVVATYHIDHTGKKL